MTNHINKFLEEIEKALQSIPLKEIAKAIHIIQGVYERDGRIYVFGNGGSLALATHWVSDFNKTVFSHHLDKRIRRFQAVRLPTTEAELTAWANDVGFEMVFAGPLQNYLREIDAVIAISSSGSSENVIKAVELAKSRNIPVIGLSGFDGGRLNQLADAKVFIPTQKGEYEIVESVHGVILHLITKYFKDYLNYTISRSKH
jgi:D-sedoheptulose 7-phosphate isomerase